MSAAAAKARVHSTWTPLNNDVANSKIFEERRILVNKWFGMWSDQQRKQILADLIAMSNLKQVGYAGDVVNRKRSVFHQDFTRVLPRVISLYIFSFLDPRSLCRSARVCWYWKYLTELDQLWMPKSVRLGWVLPFSPSPYESGVWKRMYIENIMAIKCLSPKLVQSARSEKSHKSKSSASSRESKKKVFRSHTGRHSATLPLHVTYARHSSATLPGSKPIPWKGSNPQPQDIWRNNYLDNDDEVTRIKKLRKKGVYGTEAEELIRNAKTKVRTGQHPLRRSRSVSSIYERSPSPRSRPDWARPTSAAILRDPTSTGTDASKRPPPVHPAPSPRANSTSVVNRSTLSRAQKIALTKRAQSPVGRRAPSPAPKRAPSPAPPKNASGLGEKRAPSPTTVKRAASPTGGKRTPSPASKDSRSDSLFSARPWAIPAEDNLDT